MGKVELNLPGIFSNHKNKALENFRKAKNILETQDNYLQKWEYYFLLVSIANIYLDNNDLIKYNEIKKYTLELNNNLFWLFK